VSIDELLTSVRRTLSVGAVFGEAYERDGVLVIPVARVVGGGGGGDSGDTGQGRGGGGGVAARPLGVYVVDGGAVRWHPVVDVDRLVVTAAVVVALGLWTRGRRRPRGADPSAPAVRRRQAVSGPRAG
jgi:uncharacterized spore protein YtfJ